MNSNEADKIYNKAEALTEKVIYIIGPRKFQNALMASFIERETGAECLAAENLSDISYTNDEKFRKQKLALWDCLGKDAGNCLLDFQSYVGNLSLVDFIGLFNIAPGRGIEEQTLTLGVNGFFYEHSSLEQLVKGIHAIFDGELWISRKIMSECIVKDSNRNNRNDFFMKGNETILTQRQIEILSMIAVGYSNQHVADKLCISHHTVKCHLYNIFKKINVPNRLQAAIWAAKNL